MHSCLGGNAVVIAVDTIGMEGKVVGDDSEAIGITLLEQKGRFLIPYKDL